MMRTKDPIDSVLGLVRSISAKVGMGIIEEGRKSYWPEPKGWDLFPEERDAFGDFYEVQYQNLSNPALFVTFDSNNLQSADRAPGTIKDEWSIYPTYDRGSKSSPGVYRIEAPGILEKGRWSDERDVEKVLKSADALGRKSRADLEKKLRSVRVPGWDNAGDGYFTYRGPRQEYSDADMSVTFLDPDDVLLGGETGEAEISFVKGGSYQGYSITKDYLEKYRSLSDIPKILKKAEKIFHKLDSR